MADVVSARERTARFLHRTPSVASATLGEELGASVHLKLELFQKTGSFKPRGAFNTLLEHSKRGVDRGVVAFSGGNFAQAVAYAGRMLGLRVRVLMPEGTPANYLAATRGYGAEVELMPTMAETIERTEDYRSQGWTFVHPFDHPLMMAGNGTLGVELLEEVPEATDVLVSIGGGGLMTGVAVAVKALKPQVRVWGVETEGADAMSRALAAGRVVSIEPSSLARTLGAPYVAEDALRVAREQLEGVIVVSDGEAFGALVDLIERAKLVSELSAACTLAAARRLRGELGSDRHLVLVLCGGNISVRDLCELERLFGAGAAKSGLDAEGAVQAGKSRDREAGEGS